MLCLRLFHLTRADNIIKGYPLTYFELWSKFFLIYSTPYLEVCSSCFLISTVLNNLSCDEIVFQYSQYIGDSQLNVRLVSFKSKNQGWLVNRQKFKKANFFIFHYFASYSELFTATLVPYTNKHFFEHGQAPRSNLPNQNW